MTIKQRGLIVASDETHVLISATVHLAYRIKSFSNGKSPKTWAALRTMLDAKRLASESIFDAAHGKRYILFVYKDAAERKACWDHLTRPNQ
jgi:hypothetical protein